jgi:hypothetical protein
LASSEEPGGGRAELGLDAEQQRDELDPAASHLLELRRDRADDRNHRGPSLSLAACRPVDAQDRVARARPLERRLRELLALGRVHGGKPDARGRAREPVQVLVEAERDAAIDAHGLERRAAPQQRLVVCVEHRLVRIHESAASHRHRQQRHLAKRDMTGV